jgi:hypothetical protein
MVVYLLTAVPLAYVFIVMLLEAHGMPTRITVVPAVKGAISYAIVAIVMSVLSPIFPLYYMPTTIFLHYFMDELLLPVALIVGCFFLFSRSLWHETRIDRFLGLVAFFAGYYTVAGFVDLFTHAHYFSPYTLFLLPTIRVVLMILVPSGVVAFYEERMFTRYLYITAAAAGPALGGLIAMYHVTNAGALPYLITAGFFLAGIGGGYAMVRLYLPLRF